MKIIITVSFMYLSTISNCQNLSYRLFEDSILKNIQTDYTNSKRVYNSYKDKYNYDPQNIIIFLRYSLINNDLKFYKKEVANLMKYYGYSFSSFDTLKSRDQSLLSYEIYDSGVYEWTIAKSRKKYSTWIKHNQNSVRMLSILEKMRNQDQMVRKLSFDLYPLVFERPKDSLFLNSFLRVYDSIINSVDLNNVIQIQTMCIENGGVLPNNFDNGYSISKYISLIVSHNLKREANLPETKNRLYQYIEKAFLAGKISSSLLYEYDYYLHKHTGFQYYGFLGDSIPAVESNSFKLRKETFVK